MTTPQARRWLAEPGARLDLSAVDTRSTDGAPGDKRETEASFDDTYERMLELQERLYAEDRRSLLIVLQAMDAGGKDGTIKHISRGLNPQGVRLTGFKAPTPQELAHDFLWRVHPHAPGRGEIALFNRSHYEDVVIVRVRELVPRDVWSARYEQINEFERLLVDTGTTIVKFFLHISQDEQAERLQDRLDRPDKRWKFNTADLKERARWDDYMSAYQDAISRTSTPHAPWYVVPADRKWYRNFVVGTVLLETLREMDPRYPDRPDLDGMKVV